MSVGFLFPGQGAQTIGMATDIAASQPVLAQRFEEASEAVGFDLASIIREGPLEELNRTEITQPALLAVSVGLFDVWRARGGAAPTMVAGHSLGEYSALTAAGCMEFADAVRLVHERGKLMQAAVPEGEGAMAAILGLDDDVIAACCDEAGGVVAPANYNSPGQVVIAGAHDAVQRAIAACQEAGARRIVPLDVSVPSHCPLMAPAGDSLGELLTAVELAPAQIPVVQNVDATVADDPAGVRAKLLAQLVSPVRWADSVKHMASQGVERFVECGPGAVLAGLARRIDRKLVVRGIGELEALDAALTEFAA